jgi:hypothetical protein
MNGSVNGPLNVNGFTNVSINGSSLAAAIQSAVAENLQKVIDRLNRG